MSYPSIDELQNALSDQVFADRTDKKKAAGRALGTILELITYYLLDAWNQTSRTTIELRVPEYGNPDITHNVEFALHPILDSEQIDVASISLPITAKKIFKRSKFNALPTEGRKKTELLSSKNILRNNAVIYSGSDSLLVANHGSGSAVSIRQLSREPYSIIECKRVGVEEGAKKGPTTIEKAKQGAYVAKSVSRLQKFRDTHGRLMGIYPNDDGSFEIRAYEPELEKIFEGSNETLPPGLNLTIGIVSNHGNWFTAEELNKELLVLKSAYDWLLFMSDDAMVKFVSELLISPEREYEAASSAFADSYSGKKNGTNVFTKVKIRQDADAALRKYFKTNLTSIENEWFSVLQPEGKTIDDLKNMLSLLSLRTGG